MRPFPTRKALFTLALVTVGVSGCKERGAPAEQAAATKPAPAADPASAAGAATGAKAPVHLTYYALPG